MPKKKLEVNTENGVTTVGDPIVNVTTSDIALLSLDLGRDDLNKLVDKVNEIIKKVN